MQYLFSGMGVLLPFLLPRRTTSEYLGRTTSDFGNRSAAGIYRDQLWRDEYHSFQLPLRTVDVFVTVVDSGTVYPEFLFSRPDF